MIGSDNHPRTTIKLNEKTCRSIEENDRWSTPTIAKPQATIMASQRHGDSRISTPIGVNEAAMRTKIMAWSSRCMRIFHLLRHGTEW